MQLTVSLPQKSELSCVMSLAIHLDLQNIELCF